MTTGDRIKQLRNTLGMSQEELGQKVGVKKAAINKYETGIVVNLKRSVIDKLSAALHTTPAYLMGWEDEKTNAPLDIPPNFPARLRYLREQKGETQEQLAEAMGYSPKDIDAWENGTLEADFKTKVQLASHFNSTMDFLTGNDPNKNIVVALHGGGRIVTEKKQPLSPKAVEVVKELADNVGKMDDTQLDALMAMINAMKDR